jgi:glycosyltransferase involved in cell wall biosynthesis
MKNDSGNTSANATVVTAEDRMSGATGTTTAAKGENTRTDSSPLQGKRVAMVLLSSYPADPRPRRAVETLLKQGMSIDLICVADAGAPATEVQGNLSIRRLDIAHRRGGKLAYFYEYFSFLFMATMILAFRTPTRRYDLVYIHNMPDILVISALLPKLFGAKVILDMHDPMPELMVTIYRVPEQSKTVKIIKILEKWSMKRADLVITVNIACKRIFSNRSVPAEKVGVVMNSPDGEIFPFRTPRSYPAATSSPNQPFVIMYHGSLLERNGLDLAVDAVGKIKDAVPNVILKIYGKKTPFLEQIMKGVEDRGLQEFVKYYGPKSLEGLVPAIEECDLGVIPNHRNMFTEINTPTRIFEYLALGKTVIAPDTPGILDYFDSESLFYFKAGDSDDLAERIKYVVAHREQGVAMAERAQKMYLAHTWQQERKTLIGLVGGVLAEAK